MNAERCVRCRRCGGPTPPEQALWQISQFRVVRCTECGLGRVANPPEPSQLQALYQEDYFEAPDSQGYPGYGTAEERKRLHFRSLLDEIERWYGSESSGGTLVEVGCAYGYFLDEAQRRGWTVIGVEPSRFAAARARQLFGLHVLPSITSLAEMPGGQADVVAAWDVIEHLPDPGQLIDAAYHALRPGGILALSTGDLGSLSARAHGRFWSLMTPPWHLWFFTRGALRRMLGARGFEVLTLRGDGVVLVDPGARRRVVPAWLERVLLTKPAIATFRRFARGQIVYLYARKEGGGP